MARLGHGIEELLKSWGSADVFGWSTTFAIDKPWVIDAGICGYDLFDLDAMAPIVPEIIGVGEAGNAALDELADAHIGGVAGADHEIIVVEADAIGGIADIEPEQVVVLEEQDRKSTRLNSSH